MKKSWSTEYVGNSMTGEELKGSQWPGTNKTQDGETRFVSFYSRCRSVGEYRQTYVPMCTRTSSYWKYLVVVYLSSSTPSRRFRHRWSRGGDTLRRADTRLVLGWFCLSLLYFTRVRWAEEQRRENKRLLNHTTQFLAARTQPDVGWIVFQPVLLQMLAELVIHIIVFLMWVRGSCSGRKTSLVFL